MTKKRARKPNLTYQPAILIGVALVVAVILILKAQRSSTDASAKPVPTTTGSGTMAVQVAPPTRAATSTPTIPAPTSTPAPAQQDPPTVPPDDPDAAGLAAADLAALSPEAQVDALLAAKQPIFAFFHSNTCKQCIDMTAIVEQVYPDFDGQVYLVDVNVYDKANQNLLRRANLRVIPTLIFVDRSGETWGYTGVMPATDLREQLQTLAGGG
jgi:thiol-disulfide isomerase/thioredoxin